MTAPVLAPHVPVVALATVDDMRDRLHDRHLVALSKEMNIPMAEVYEVATFYHHFEVLKGDATPAQLTVRVCDGLSLCFTIALGQTVLSFDP